MNERAFPNHSGGVVQVHHVTRYGAVPEALLEDERLNLDTRAVAAWLTVKPSGWQICVTSLRLRLAPLGKKMLGKDLWQRIANELESAGYLQRKKVKGHGGQWTWHVTFNPAPANFTIAGSAGYGGPSDGLAGSGRAVDGSAGGGQPGYKEVPGKEIPKKKNTTTTTTGRPKNRPGQERTSDRPELKDGINTLQFPEVTGKERTELERVVAACAIESQQDVLDEVEGIRQAGGIKRGVVALASKLVEKVAKGEFVLSAGYKVQVQRQARGEHASALKLAAGPAQGILTMSEESLAMLPPNMRKNARESMLRQQSCIQGPPHSQEEHPA